MVFPRRLSRLEQLAGQVVHDGDAIQGRLEGTPVGYCPENRFRAEVRLLQRLGLPANQNSDRATRYQQSPNQRAP
jgi:hypothetical protein